MKKKWILSPRQSADLELILNGGFYPLSGFHTQAEYLSILNDMRLCDGTIWPIPIVLDVPETFAKNLQIAEKLSLLAPDNTILAELQISDIWQPDKSIEAKKVYGTEDNSHPGVDYLLRHTHAWYLGGNIIQRQVVPHFDFLALRQTPATLKAIFKQRGWEKIVGFQTRNPMHKAHFALTRRAAADINGQILLHPVVGPTQPHDIDYATRVQCYQKILPYYPAHTTLLSLLPLAMRMAGPREALWHAIIRKNYGCTHFIIGRDHAGPGLAANGKPFYDIYAAQKLVTAFEADIGISILVYPEIFFVKERQNYYFSHEILPTDTVLRLSGTQLRRALTQNTPIPAWFSFPEVIDVLKSATTSGCTIFFTGLSGAGKTTLAKALYSQLKLLGYHQLSLLDSDITRRTLATDLGFSKKDRHLNAQRLGFVACEVTKVGGIAICAAIAPFAASRDFNRQYISTHGTYIEIYVSTPLSECARRDVKGLYQQAYENKILNVTGIDDPYEPPQHPEITINTLKTTIPDSIEKIITYLRQVGVLTRLEEKNKKTPQSLTSENTKTALHLQ